MGQAFDQGGNVIAEALGDTKREVFEKLAALAPNATEIRIRSLEAQVERLSSPINSSPMQGDCDQETTGDSPVKSERRRQLFAFAMNLADQVEVQTTKRERCMLRRMVENLLE